MLCCHFDEQKFLFIIYSNIMILFLYDQSFYAQYRKFTPILRLYRYCFILSSQKFHYLPFTFTFIVCLWVAVKFGEGNGNPLQYSCLENPMDGGAWQAAVHGVTKSWTRLSNFSFIFHFPALEKEMATHSSVLAWRIPGTGEPGGLPSMGSHKVGHD